MAAFVYEEGDKTGALDHCERALAIFQAALPPDHLASGQRCALLR